MFDHEGHSYRTSE